MSPSAALTILVVTQATWTFEAAPLVDPGFKTEQATALTSTWVLAIGSREGAPTSTVFATRPDAGVTQLGTWTTASFHEGSGSGLTVVTSNDAGVEVFAVRNAPTPSLVSLGVFTKEPAAVTCDAPVKECVLLLTDDEPTWWRAGTRSRLFSETDEALAAANLSPGGATLAPGGGWVGLVLGENAALYELATGKITIFRGNVTHTAKSLKELVSAVGKPPLQQKLERAADTCNTHPTGWSNGRLQIQQLSNFEVEGPECKYPSFSVDPRLLTRQALKGESYPWDVFDCPNGGWGSSAGTLLTGCQDQIHRMMRARPERPRGIPAEPIDPDDTGELPEAIALSETELFIMAPARVSNWDWYRRTPRINDDLEVVGTGSPVVLNGPSVVTFTPKGVQVQAVAWPYGKAIFETSLDDDWHLIKPTRQPPALVRFIRR